MMENQVPREMNKIAFAPIRDSNQLTHNARSPLGVIEKGAGHKRYTIARKPVYHSASE